MLGILIILGMLMIYDLINKLVDIKKNKVNETYIELNNIKFYYNPKELKINDDILDKLNNFIPEEDEYCYSMYIDETQGLVIY